MLTHDSQVDDSNKSADIDSHQAVKRSGDGDGILKYLDSDGRTIDFSAIRAMCETEDAHTSIDLSPSAFRNQRKNNWPGKNEQGMGPDLSIIYDKVKPSRVPNAIGVRALLPRELNLAKWEELLTDSVIFP